MITRFKLFEDVSKLPQVGDWVIFNVAGMGNSRLDAVELIIGKILKINKDNWFDIKFKLTGAKGSFTHFFNIKDFKYWSNNKEELEILLQKDKYNL